MKINIKILSAFLLLSLIPLVIISVIAYSITEETFAKQVLSRLENVVSLQKHRIESIVAQNLDRLALISSNTKLRMSLNNYIKLKKTAEQQWMHAILLNIQSSISDFKDLSILTLGGEVAVSTNLEKFSKTYSDKEFFIKGKKRNNAESFFLDENQNLGIYLSGPLYYKDELLGVLVIESNADNIISLVKNYSELGETGETILAKKDKDGNALFLTPLRFDPNAALRKIVSKDDTSAPITQALLKNINLFMNVKDYREKPVLAATEYIDNPGWGLVVKMDSSEAFAPVASLRNTAIIIGITVLIFVIVLASIISETISDPILALRKGAEIIGSGNLDYKVGTSARDEIGQLSRAFDQMTEKLKVTTVSRDELAKEIVERKRTEDALDEAYHTTRDIIANAPLGIYLVNEKGNMEYVNPAMLKIADTAREQFMSINVFNFLPYKTINITEKIKEGLKEGKYFKMDSIEYTSYFGRKATIRNFTGIPLDEKGARKMLIIVEDITERKKIERLKDEFVSIVSHELRTPLAITKEGINLILDGASGKINEKQEKLLTSAKNNINRLARIINNLLDISKLEAGKIEFRRELVDMRGLVKQVVSFFEPKAKEKGLSLIINMPEEKIEAYVDTDKMMQVFTNLLGNALKFTQKGRIDIFLGQRKSEIECAVMDTGVGISEESLPRIFDKFQQFGRHTGGAEKGTGLGLSIAKGFVEMHNGKIWAESKPGKGTKFIFILPKYTVETFFEERVNSEIENAKKKDSKMSLAAASITGFDKVKAESSDKKIQSILNDIEDIIKDNLRLSGDMVLRTPDGLAAILADCDKENAAKVKIRLKHILDNYITQQKLIENVKLRFGCATYPDEAKSSKELIKKIEMS